MRKTSIANANDMINDYINRGRTKKVLHLITQDKAYNGREILIDNRKFINFGNCSYLGLELDPRLKTAAKACIDKYGVQFSSSRTYLQCTAYHEWEALLSQLFEAPVVTFTSVSLGHHAVIPVVVEPGDAIILDQQVHASVQDPARKMMLNGVHVEAVRHNRLELLEERIKALNNKYRRIWYMIDGVYSMYGDFAPMKEIVTLLDKYPGLHLYADDAHGMSIAGKNGAGIIYSQVPHHKKMVLATSLNKAFGAGGGVFLFADEARCLRVKNCAGAYIFSGGHQMPVIGAGIASAKIHLSDEIVYLQENLKEKLNYCHQLLEERQLPVLSNPAAPIFYIGVGLVNTCMHLVSYLHDDGCYVNIGMFPAVPDQSAGVRFAITAHHRREDIEYLVERIAYHYPRTFRELGRSARDVERGFGRVKQFNLSIEGIPVDIVKTKGYEIQHETSIRRMPRQLWDRLVGSLGANNWEQMLFFEETFSENPLPEHNWKFHYYLIRDKKGHPVVATFFTEALAKDDMFAPPEVSRQLERLRRQKNDPYYMCSKTLTMGCLLSVGEHIYIDKSHSQWQQAFVVLLEAVQSLREAHDLPVLSLRDFDTEDEAMKAFLIDLGLKRVNIPDGHLIDRFEWHTPEEFLTQLKGKHSKSTHDRRNYVRRRAIGFEHHFDVQIIKSATEAEIKHFRRLYLNVSEKSYDITGFTLPEKFFKNVVAHPRWEVLILKLKSHYDPSKQRKAVGMAICYKTDRLYSFLVTGLDYDFLAEHNVYTQILWQTIKRARQLVLPVNMGITASQPKRKFGAKLMKYSMYVQNKDTFKDLMVSLLPKRESGMIR